jgi:protocatechuate 3,4-dioxygenase beta subunit
MAQFGAFFLGIVLLLLPVSAQIPAGQFPAAPGLPQAPARDATPKTGTARIRGRVLAADTGQPLRKAQVRAISPDLRENRLATTDRDGLYEFTELPAGRYQLTASKGSFVQLQYGQTRPFEAGKPLEIGEGQTIERVDFGLPRGSLITGRVMDEFGEPATDVQVAALRYQFVQGRRQLVPAGRTVTTNDLGEYRVFGLPPGQYYVSATLRAGSSCRRPAITSADPAFSW